MYFRIGNDTGVLSPVGRAWHFHGRVSRSNSKRAAVTTGSNFRFLALMTRTLKRISPGKLALSVKARNISPSVDSSLYDNYAADISKYRTRTDDNDYYKLYNRQEGLCEFCNLPLIEEDDISVNIANYMNKTINFPQDTNKLEIHHIKPIKIGGHHEGLSNKTLMHESCHKAIQETYGYDKISDLPYKKS